MKLKTLSIAKLLPAEYNPRKDLKPSDPEYQKLKKSITKFGYIDPIIWNKRSGAVVGGHQRLKVLKERGDKNAQVIVVDLDPSHEKAANLALNKISGDWDRRKLVQILTELTSEDFDIDLTGFDETELKELIDWDGEKGSTDQDDAPDLPKKATTKPGQIWKLGAHRVMCGDSTKTGDVQHLMHGGGLADMVFTDPPYKVNYSGRGKQTKKKIENDNLEQNKFKDFLRAAFQNFRVFTKKEAPMYCCYASRTHREFEDTMNDSGWETINQIIWVKPVGSMGWGDYRRKHEPMFYARKPGGKVQFHGDRKQYTVWEKEKTDGELLQMFKRMIDKEENGGSTVWRFKRDTNYKHPTQKPVDLIIKALMNSCPRKGTVLDLFSGSGSTLIAAEKLGRTCYGMELDPAYCDVIVTRWQDFTGEKAVLA